MGGVLVTKYPIIAFGHQSRAGKDTAAEAILDMQEGNEPLYWPGRSNGRVRVVRAKFAHKLKLIAEELFFPYGMCRPDFYEQPGCEKERDTLLPEIGLTPVDLWIEVGQAMRQIHPDVWADATLRQAAPDRLLVISDLRFPNEFRKVQELGGWCVRIDRPGQSVKGSDEELGPEWPWDAAIYNAFDLETFKVLVRNVARSYWRAFHAL